MKVIANISILVTIFIFLCLIDKRQRILFILVLIFFPMPIRVLGKDAFSISTVLIYSFSIFFFIRYRYNIKFDRFAIVLITLAILGGISTFQVPPDLLGRAIRKYSDFVSSLFFFAYIYYQYSKIDTNKELDNFHEKFLSLYLIMVSTQIVISVLMYKVPLIENLFGYFSFKELKDINPFFEQEIDGIKRMQGLIYSYEGLAENIAVLCPIVLYKYYKTSRLFWLIIYGLLFIGLVYTRTRSGILLFSFGTIVFSIFNFKRIYFKTNIVLIFFGLLCIILSVYFFNYIYKDLLVRLNVSYQNYNSGNILEAINRPGLIDNFQFVIREMGLWGKGLISVYDYTGQVQFHSLYQTIMFQFGIFGSIFYFLVILLILFKLTTAFLISFKTKYQLITFSILLSYIIFLVNEIKFEFNRGEAYQQIIWALFGSYMLISRHIKYKIKSY
jgi:hypothetical protein